MPLSNPLKRTLSEENKSEAKKTRFCEDQTRKLSDAEEAAENLLKLAMAEPQRKANFSALNTTNSNGMNKNNQAVGAVNKQGTAKKLVIKNFKGSHLLFRI